MRSWPDWGYGSDGNFWGSGVQPLYGERRNEGLDVPPELLAHISPLGWAHILLTGEYLWPNAASA
ncbi:Tn3 family transposase [Xanthomonas arboricola pv. corylina]|uniref:Tn3 family transposase n=1 Tax=Xanthomonas arboricola TaxID=56448 RepID=UPI000E1FCD4C